MFNVIRRPQLFSAGMLALAVSLALSDTLVAQRRQASVAQRVGLEGHCPVCILAAEKWVPGSSKHQSTYDGITYYFPSAREKNRFEVNPASYVPALAGDCTVCYAKAGKRVPGNVRHSVLHKGRLFLFPSEREQQVFLKDPKAFENVDLALDGNCAVCLAHAKKKVSGKAEHLVIYKGFCYLFPSDRERQVFLKNPEKYSKVRLQSSKKGANQSKELVLVNAKSPVTVSGKSGCAACEHGVVPIGAPKTLGLAINAPDGKIFVVEDAHKLYPEIYEKRFNGLPLQATGEVIQTKGKVHWLRPTSLKVRGN